MTNKLRRAVAFSAFCAVLAGTAGAVGGTSVQAALRPRLSTSKFRVLKGQSRSVVLKKAKGAKKIKWSFNKKSIVKIKGKKNRVTVTGKKAGSGKLTCRFEYKGKKKKLSCRVVVYNSGSRITAKPSATSVVQSQTPAPQNQTAAPQNQPSQNPTSAPQDQTPTPPVPTATLEPIPVKEDIDANATYDIEGSLKSAYGRFFGNVGTSVNIFQIDPSKSFFQDDHGEMFEFTKGQYNSITPENETKPCRLLNMGEDLRDYFATDFKAQTMPVSEARENKYYFVPDSYKEEVCPKINYSQFDTFLEKAAANGMRIRFHAFVWHQQTPKWLFKENFDAEQNWVTPDVMDARMEYYIKSVIRYICLKEQEMGYGDVVYCYDVANEYFHNNDRTDDEGKAEKSYWDEVYYPENELKPSGSYTQVEEPEYVKKAFTYAREMLDEYGKSDVSLFYNDYNTYMVTDKILHLVEYVNKEKILCDGVGMQSHLDVSYPSIPSYTAALKKFLDCEFIHEVQITELDVTAYENKRKTLNDQMEYYYKLMQSILEMQEQYPGKITGMTFWGLYDSFSWRRDGRPLLFDSITKAKGVYYKVLQAAAEASLKGHSESKEAKTPPL